MEDFKTWNELTGEQQNLAIEMFKLHEKEEFGDIYNTKEATEVLSQRDDFIVMLDEDGEIEVY